MINWFQGKGVEPEQVQVQYDLYNYKGLTISHQRGSFFIPSKEIKEIYKTDSEIVFEYYPDADDHSFNHVFKWSKDLGEEWYQCHHKSLNVIDLFFSDKTLGRIGVFITLAVVLSFSIYVFYGDIIKQVTHQVPHKVDSYLGDNFHQKLTSKYSLCEDDVLQSKLDSSYQYLFAGDSLNFKAKIHIIEDPMVNAFALPGGNIYFMTGFLEQTDSFEEVLGVMAHEIGHVEKRHGLQQLLNSVGMFVLVDLFFGFAIEGVITIEEIEILETLISSMGLFAHSREFEKESDQYAIKHLNEHKVSLQGMVDFFERMENKPFKKKNKSKDSISDSVEVDEMDSSWYEKIDLSIKIPEWISTHPSSSNRVKELKSNLLSKKDHQDFDKENWAQIKNNCKEFYTSKDTSKK